MIALVIASATLTGFKLSAPGDVAPSSGTTGAQVSPKDRAAGVEFSAAACNGARKGLRWYSHYFVHWTKLRVGAGVPGEDWALQAAQIRDRPGSCPRYLSKLMRSKARAARGQYVRWLEEHTLREARTWKAAVYYVQRFFPGTASWLMSCSGAEGAHGHWKPYHEYGDHYYAGYERVGAVGGWMQFQWGTLKGMYRHALDHLRAREYRVPQHLRDPGALRAWLSPLAQALAAGWARWSGNDDSHWSASWGSGC